MACGSGRIGPNGPTDRPGPALQALTIDSGRLTLARVCAIGWHESMFRITASAPFICLKPQNISKLLRKSPFLRRISKPMTSPPLIPIKDKCLGP